jgi:hypothetical protein
VSQFRVTLGIALRDIGFCMTQDYMSMFKTELMSNLGLERVPDLVRTEDGNIGPNAAALDRLRVRILVVNVSPNGLRSPSFSAPLPGGRIDRRFPALPLLFIVPG